jgi:hypothetical protein
MRNDKTIQEIRSRWHTLDIIAHWINLTPSRRNQVIREIETDTFLLREDNPELARDYSIALDALEALSSVPQVYPKYWIKQTQTLKPF